MRKTGEKYVLYNNVITHYGNNVKHSKRFQEIVEFTEYS